MGPAVVFVTLAGGILFFLYARRARRERPLVTKRNKLLVDPDIESSMMNFSTSTPSSNGNYHTHELRATAAGDSTLRVSLNFQDA